MRFYGVVVSTLDFESSDLGSTPDRTSDWLFVHNDAANLHVPATTFL